MPAAEHPGLHEWIDLLQDRLEPGRARALRGHLRTGCGACGRARDWAEKVVVAAAEPVEEPPAATLSHGRALFTTHRPRGLADEVRRFFARLLPPAEPALADVRGAAAEARTYEAGPYLVELTPESGARRGRRTLRGRIVRRDTGLGVPGVARLTRGGAVKAQAAVDDLGEIVLRDVVVSDATLEIHAEGDRIDITV